MLDCKLQIGCTLVLLYIMGVYYRERVRYGMRWHFKLFDALMLSGLVMFVFDGATAYTVNRLDTVSPALNLLLHGAFLVSIDVVVFVEFLYLLEAVRGLPKRPLARALLLLPLAVNLAVVLLHLGDLEYRQGRISNYSMGVSAYACFAMAALYTLMTILLALRYYRVLPLEKRFPMLLGIVMFGGVSLIQLLLPDILMTSIALLMVILGAYTSREDPALRELHRYHRQMVTGFAELIEERDESTGGHVKRTTQYVQLLSHELQRRGLCADTLTRDYVKNMILAAPMHDVGKIAIPDAILKKPGRLTAEEFEIMKTHAARGKQIIDETFSRVGREQYVEIAGQIARHHHEKWNGRGYPDGLAGEDIPLCARIMAIADVFDAVSEKRCYREAMSLEESLAIIREGSGRDFDPMLTEIFLELRDDVTKIRDGYDEELFSLEGV